MSSLRIILSGAALAAALSVLPACQSQMTIPASAVSMVASRGPTVSYRATEPGTIYVQNRSTGELVYAGPVTTNEVVNVDANAGQVVIANRVVAQRPLRTGDEYVFYLDRSRYPDRARTVERRTVIEQRTVREAP